MPDQKRITAFTLVEMLVVLVIFGMMMALSGGFSSRTRDTFVAQQYIKSAVQNARILRRKSMLITRNSGETSWVQGIGFRLDIDDTTKQWKMTQVKALSPSVTGNYFYQSFPVNTPCLELSWVPSSACAGTNKLTLTKLESSSPQILQEGLSFGITTGGTPKTCDTSLTVIYESINGKIHAYCQNVSTTETVISGTLDLKIRITYKTGDSYKYFLNLKDDGEINATR